MSKVNNDSLPFAKVREKFIRKPIVDKIVQIKPIIKLKIKTHDVIKNDTQVTPSNIKNDTQITLSNIKNDTQVTPSNTKNDTQVTPSNIKNDTQITLSNIKNDTQITLSNIKNDTQVTLSNTKNDTQVTPSNTKNDTQVTPSNTKNDTQVTLSNIKNDTQVTPSNTKNVTYQCVCCGKSFTHKNAMYRHRKHYCKKRIMLSINESTQQIQDYPKTKLQPKTKEPESIQQLQEKIKQIEEEKKQSDQSLLAYMKKQEQIIEKLSNMQAVGIGTQNNITINQTVNVYLDQHSLNLYDKKKQLHGARSALDFLQQTMKNAKPNNKLNWVNDPDILGQSASPILRKSKGQYLVNVSSTQTKTCDLTQVNKITNDIMSNSVFKAINEAILPLTEQFENQTDIEKSHCSDDFFSPVYETPFGNDIYHNLERYQTIIPLEKNINSVSRVES